MNWIPGDHLQKPEIEDYFDYREYLRDLFEWKKHENRVFSHRYIVRKAGYKSPTLLKDVIDQKKNLSLVSAERFARAFKLSEFETQYFLLLLKFNTAETLGEKDSFFNDLTLLRKTQNHRQISQQELNVLDNWWILALREAIELPDYDNSNSWLAKALQKEISTEKVERALEILFQAGLIKKERGNWQSCDAVIKTERNVQSLKVAHYHRQMIELAKDALFNVASGEREISGTTLRIPLHKVDEIKDRLYALRQSILQMAESSENADQVFQLNFQFFPLVKTNRLGLDDDSRKGEL